MAIRDFLAYDPGRYWWNSFFFSLLDDTGLRSLLIAASAFGWLGLAVSWYTLGAAKIAFPLRLFFGVALTIALAYPRHKIYEQGLSLVLVSTIYFVLVAPHQLKRWFFFGCMTGIAAVYIFRKLAPTFIAICFFHSFVDNHAWCMVQRIACNAFFEGGAFESWQCCSSQDRCE